MLLVANTELTKISLGTLGRVVLSFLASCSKGDCISCLLDSMTWEQCGNSVSLFPGLPRSFFFFFFVLQFAFSIINGGGREVKNGEGLGTPIICMMPGGREVDIG